VTAAVTARFSPLRYIAEHRWPTPWHSVRNTERGGFTLIEILVALALAAIVMIAARGLLDGLMGQAAAIVRAGQAADSLSGAEQSVRRTVGNLALPVGDTLAFEGDAGAARFVSWCAVPGGWLERCAVQLTARDSGGVRMVQNSGEVTLLHAGRLPALCYLSSVRDGGTWVNRWRSATDAPLAIGIVNGSDTAVMRVGELR
jgi:prepilin-type N-terminal cleavage/methylation domain-containing protein